MRRRFAFVPLRGVLLVGASLLAAPPARADASLDVPAGRCAAALATAGERFLAEIGGSRDGLDIDPRRARVAYYATLDMCGIADDYRGGLGADGRARFEIEQDDGGHAAAFKRAFRAALRLCAASR